MQRSNTPVILAACSHGLIAAMSGVNYWIYICTEVEGYDVVPLELTIYNAIDVFLLFYSFKLLDPPTYTLIQASVILLLILQFFKDILPQ